MIYGSICSGIEAATVGWHPLGWRPAFFSEIEAFPRAVLQHHYPETPLHGDFTTIEAGQYAAIDLLVGGTPCQSFSVAGLRAGLRDERGNLALEFCLLARRLRPRWIVWENVPGVLSLDGGRAFASILGGLAECGYGLAYRVLDAQFVRVDGFARAVPQRRRRVFVVGYLGDWRRAAAVLFEREGLRWDPAPRREAGQRSAATLGTSAARRRGLDDRGDAGANIIANEIAQTLTRGAESSGKGGYAGRRQEDDSNLVAHTLNAKGGAGRSDSESETFLAEHVSHALRAGGFDASEDGTGRGTPLVPIAFDETQITSAENRCNPQPGDPCHPLVKGGRPPTLAQGVALRGRENGATAELTGDVMTALRCGGGGGDKPHVLTSWRVRRLMPVECERLQGFPDGYTAISYRGKPAADGPRYKALGNSMAVNVMRWLSQRIEMVDAIESGRDAA